MNRFRSISLTAALAALLTAGVVYGQGPDRRGGPGVVVPADRGALGPDCRLRS